MLKLLEREHGLAWTSHPRIKASNWTPDIYRREDFYLSEHWLGAAWKADILGEASLIGNQSRETSGSKALRRYDAGPALNSRAVLATAEAKREATPGKGMTQIILSGLAATFGVLGATLFIRHPTMTDPAAVLHSHCTLRSGESRKCKRPASQVCMD
jgi:hypothetical protein